ncbi:MAG: DUF4440 domain-containing protein [Calditrichaceae bacterium]
MLIQIASMQSYFIIVYVSCSLLIECNHTKDPNLIQKYKNEIRETELAFARLVKEKGLKTAFVTYAADEAVIKRGETLIKGKKAIEAYYKNQTLQNVQLEWEPEFIDVAASGDLGYTYGPFTFHAFDSTGKEIKSRGIFHTVWKRHVNGEWRYVWD